MSARTLIVRMAPAMAACALVIAGCAEAGPADLEPAASVFPPRPVQMDYAKFETGAGTLNWLGRVSGDIQGNLETRVTGAWQSGHILHIRTQWRVVAGTQSFEAALDGTLDTATGALLLNGIVTGGYLSGARVHNEGQLTGVDGATGGTIFHGVVRVMPASAR